MISAADFSDVFPWMAQYEVRRERGMKSEQPIGNRSARWKDDGGRPLQRSAGETGHPMVPLKTMVSAHRRVFERVEAINRLWLESVQEANSTGADLSARLVTCDNPAESTAVCSGWALERATRFASDLQEATTLWMGIYGSAVAGSNQAVDPHRKDEEPSVKCEIHLLSKAA